MAYSRMGFGGLLLIILVAALKGFNAYQRHNPSDGPSSSPTQDYAERQREAMERDFERKRQQQQQWQDQRRRTNEQFFAQTRQTHDAFRESADRTRELNQQRLQQANDYARQQAERQRQLLEQQRAITNPGHASSSAPTYNTSSQTAVPTPPPAPVIPEPVKIELDLTLSPHPEQEALVDYQRWSPASDYSQWLGDAHKLGPWTFNPSTEFYQSAGNPRMAKWDASGGTRGVGLDVYQFELYPRDKGLTSPVIEDTETKQVFRLGRRTITERGDAEVTYKDLNGLLVWRIHVPASERLDLATCYYTAIVDDQAIVITARYDKDKPAQVTAFDAIAETLKYVQAEE